MVIIVTGSAVFPWRIFFLMIFVASPNTSDVNSLSTAVLVGCRVGLRHVYRSRCHLAHCPGVNLYRIRRRDSLVLVVSEKCGIQKIFIFVVQFLFPDARLYIAFQGLAAVDIFHKYFQDLIFSILMA